MTDNRDAHTEQIAETLADLMGCEMGDVTDDNGTTDPYALCTSSAHNYARHDGRSCEFVEYLMGALLPVVARIKADAEQATNDAYTLGYMKGREQQAAEMVAAIETLPVLRRWIDDSELVDLADLHTALSAGRTALDTQLAQARAEALRKFADSRGVNVGDDDSEWWQGYRQAQRECLHDAINQASAEASGEGQ